MTGPLRAASPVPFPTGASLMRPKLRRRAQGGFSLAEFLVAAAIFLIVTIAVYSAFQQSRQTFEAGESNAELQQRTRLAFELVLEELRLAGFDYNRDGDENAYPDHPDEQLEFVSSGALTFRGNLDHDSGDSGRESDLELGPSDPDFGLECCPIVTTGNDEIITFALRSADSAANLDTITFNVDTSAPRDAGWDTDGNVADEESITIENVDLSNANPPYTLLRFHLESDGSVVERVMASNIRSMTFLYEGGDGEDYYCMSPEEDGTCLAGNQVPFDTLGGGDDITAGDGLGRSGRADVRSVRVLFEGMAAEDDPNFVDETDEVMPHRRKLLLDARIAPQNLGIRGRPDLDAITVPAPTGVTLCGGQCNTVRVEWNEVGAGVVSYVVNLYLQGETEPFFVGFTPGVAVLDSDPPRVYAHFNSVDAPEILDGNTLYARVRSRTEGDRLSQESAASSPLVLTDVTRLEAPKTLTATGYDPSAVGWPDVVDNLIPPLTNSNDTHAAQGNAIVLRWDAPEFALDVTDQSSPETTWTTLPASAALACDEEPIDEDGDEIIDDMRTRARELTGDIRYLVFRSEDQYFIPTEADLVAEIIGESDVATGQVSFMDTTVHLYRNGIFERTANALENCRTYFYRIRAADACWDGTEPASRTNVNLSPFEPKLNIDPTAPDSDDIDGVAAAFIGPAIPGFAVLQAKPEKPEALAFHNYDSDTADGDGIDATVGFDAVKKDRTQVDPTDPNSALMPEHVVVTEYRLYSHATDSNFPRSDAINETNGVRLDRTILLNDPGALRVARDDENGDGTVQPIEDETDPILVPDGFGTREESGLYVDLGDGTSRWYRLMAVQCSDEDTVPNESNPDVHDYSQLSDAVLFPCDFGGGENSVIDVDTTDFDNSVTATAYPEDEAVPATYGRLILKDPATGERAISDWPGVAVDASNTVVFDSDHIDQLTNNFGSGEYRISVEMTDINGCVADSAEDNHTLDVPPCCLSVPDPPFEEEAGRRIRQDLTEVCNTLRIQIHEIAFTTERFDGRPKVFQEVWWGDTQIWDGNARSGVANASTSAAFPLVIDVGGTAAVRFRFNRDITGNSVTVRYVYTIAGTDGLCEFVEDLF